MKILKEISRKYKEKEYLKFKVNIPKKILEKAGIKVGDEVNISASNREILLKKGVKIVE